MHIVVVDIAILGDLVIASANHFHAVAPFHDLLTIWFSYGQIMIYYLRSGYLVYLPSLFLFMYSQVILIRTRNPPIIFFKELKYILRAFCRNRTNNLLISTYVRIRTLIMTSAFITNRLYHFGYISPTRHSELPCIKSAALPIELRKQNLPISYVFIFYLF